MSTVAYSLGTHMGTHTHTHIHTQTPFPTLSFSLSNTHNDYCNTHTCAEG